MKSFWMLIFLLQRAGLYCHLNLLFVTLGLRLWKVLVRCPKKQNIHQYFDSLNIDVRSFSHSTTLKLSILMVVSVLLTSLTSSSQTAYSIVKTIPILGVCLYCHGGNAGLPLKDPHLHCTRCAVTQECDRDCDSSDNLL